MSNKKSKRSRGNPFAQRYKHAEIIVQSNGDNPPSGIIEDYSRLKSPHHKFPKNGGPDEELYETALQEEKEMLEALYYINKVQNK